MGNYIDKITKIAESLNWDVAVNYGYVCFRIKTTEDQDCRFEIGQFDNAVNFIEELWDHYENFDVSTEAYKWLDSSGHGINGAAYDMIDVYNNIKKHEPEIFKLSERLAKALMGTAYIFLNEHTDIITGNTPIDMNNGGNEDTAIEYKLPDNFSEKAKKFWEYLEGAAFIFEYEGRLVVTDESLELTENGNVAPRWVLDSWEELEKILEECYDDYVEDILSPEEKNIFNSGAVTFINNGWQVVIALINMTAIDLQEIYDAMQPDRINWNAFTTGDDLWYADGSKSVKTKNKDDIAKTIWFGK